MLPQWEKLGVTLRETMIKTTHRQRCSIGNGAKQKNRISTKCKTLTCLIFLQCCKIRVLIMWATNTRHI